MTEIIEFGYHNTFAIAEDFDLNQFRKLTKVKACGETYVPEEQFMSIHFGKTVISDKHEADNAKIQELEKQVDQRYKWWQKEKEDNVKLAEKIKCLKLQLEEVKCQTP